MTKRYTMYPKKGIPSWVKDWDTTVIATTSRPSRPSLGLIMIIYLKENEKKKKTLGRVVLNME